MKKLILATAVTSLFTGALAYAEEPVPDNSLTFNAAVTSDYRYRGISQTRLKPALQGGADYTNNPTGLYAGTWLSTIKWIDDAGGDSKIEWDVYGGKRGNFTELLTYDVGVLSYIYPSNELPVSANTTEVYAQLGVGPAYVKYSYSTTNLFGFADSKGSGYLDVGANISLPGEYVLNLHAGQQSIKNNDFYEYNDWKVGVTKDFGVVTVSLAVIGTDAEEAAYTYDPAGEDKFLGKTGAVLTVSKTF